MTVPIPESMRDFRVCGRDGADSDNKLLDLLDWIEKASDRVRMVGNKDIDPRRTVKHRRVSAYSLWVLRRNGINVGLGLNGPSVQSQIEALPHGVVSTTNVLY